MLAFLSLEFEAFSDQLGDEDKLVDIVKKSWNKMTSEGQEIVKRELVGGLSPVLRGVVGRALA